MGDPVFRCQPLNGGIGSQVLESGIRRGSKKSVDGFKEPQHGWG